MSTKICYHKNCSNTNPQPLSNFTKDRSKKDGHTNECKPCSRARINAYNSTIPEKRYAQGGTLRSRFNAGRNAAKNRELTWDILFDQYSAIIADGKCHYCKGKLSGTGCALDRIDSTIGYILSNVVSCCKTCNETKGEHMSYEEMRILVKLRRSPKIKAKLIKSLRITFFRMGLP